MKLTGHFFFLLFGIALFTTSCKKEGCINENAINFDADAKEDNGSCQYQAKTSFWFNAGVSGFLVDAYSVTELTVFMDEIAVGTMNPSDWKIGPDCGGENFTVTNDLGSTPSKAFTYTVRDQFGNKQFNGSVSLDANACQNVQLKW